MAAPLGADLSGKTCLVTGASAGIGLAAARALAEATGGEAELALVDVARAEDELWTVCRDMVDHPESHRSRGRGQDSRPDPSRD